MMKPGAMLGAVVAALAVSSTPGISQQPSQAPAREGPTLILAAKVPLTGVAGRIDHFTFDPKRRLKSDPASRLYPTIWSPYFTGSDQRAGDLCASLRCILRNPSQTSFKKSTGGWVDDVELTLVGTPNMEHRGNANRYRCSPFARKEPHDGQSSNGINSILAHRGGGCIQPRNCPVPRRRRSMAHPSSEGKRGSIDGRSRRKPGP